MKRIIALLLALAVSFTLCACGDKSISNDYPDSDLYYSNDSSIPGVWINCDSFAIYNALEVVVFTSDGYFFSETFDWIEHYEDIMQYIQNLISAGESLTSSDLLVFVKHMEGEEYIEIDESFNDYCVEKYEVKENNINIVDCDGDVESCSYQVGESEEMLLSYDDEIYEKCYPANPDSFRFFVGHWNVHTISNRYHNREYDRTWEDDSLYFLNENLTFSPANYGDEWSYVDGEFSIELNEIRYLKLKPFMVSNNKFILFNYFSDNFGLHSSDFCIFERA